MKDLDMFRRPGALSVAEPQTLSMTTADGTRLDADIWRPEGEGPWPVLLQRQAYGRRIGCTICYAHPAWYAAQGYLVVVQDVRGRGTSEGIFRPGEAEAADGAEAVEWAARLPGSDGRVAMYGFSYQAYDQLLAACGDSPSLAALIPAMGPWDPCSTWIFEGGAWKLQQMAGWGVQITAEESRRQGDATAYTRLKASVGRFDGPRPAMPGPLMEAGEMGHYAGWVGRDEADPYWQSISPAAELDRLKARRLPMLFIGGWYDTHIASTLQAFAALDRADDPTLRLWVGPWVHFPWERRAAGVDFGPEAVPDMDRVQVDFLDAVLKGKGRLGMEDRVRLFDVGAKCWHQSPALPGATQRLYLTGGGRAATRIGDGGLAGLPGSGSEFLLHDPWRPAPVVGLCYGAVPGPADRRAVDERGDVMTFTGEAVVGPTLLSGPVKLSVAVGADQPSFDLSATLSRVTAAGKVEPLCAGYRHFRTPPAAPAELDLGRICVTLAEGEALRISLAAADFPAHPVNPGTGGDPRAADVTEARITTLHLMLGADCALDLPVPVPVAG